MKAIISQCENLTGRVRSEIQLIGTIHSEGKIIGRLSKPIGYEEYKGEYSVTPKFDEQTLDTKNQVMKDDVTVCPISITKVSNTSGGNTVIIGG